jgi:hypothetical protein
MAVEVALLRLLIVPASPEAVPPGTSVVSAMLTLQQTVLRTVLGYGGEPWHLIGAECAVVMMWNVVRTRVATEPEVLPRFRSTSRTTIFELQIYSP